MARKILNITFQCLTAISVVYLTAMAVNDSIFAIKKRLRKSSANSLSAYDFSVDDEDDMGFDDDDFHKYEIDLGGKRNV